MHAQGIDMSEAYGFKSLRQGLHVERRQHQECMHFVCGSTASCSHAYHLTVHPPVSHAMVTPGMHSLERVSRGHPTSTDFHSYKNQQKYLLPTCVPRDGHPWDAQLHAPHLLPATPGAHPGVPLVLWGREEGRVVQGL